MNPDPRIIDNIKKLKELGMSKEDIKDNLMKMGVSSEDSDELIRISFGEEKIEEKIEEKEKVIKVIVKKEVTKKETPKKEEKIKEEIPDNLFNLDEEITTIKLPNVPEIKVPKKEPDITKGLDLEGLNIFENESTISFDNLNISKKKKEPDTTTDVWETGLVTTINTKINEVEIRQAKMEEYLKTKINTEIDKYKKIQETMKQLLYSKIEEQIIDQTKGITTQFTKQLALLKVEQAKLNKKTEEINLNKKDIENLIKQLQELQIQAEQTNKENKENINKIVVTTTVKLNAKIKEINDILALQSKITQGLIKNTQGIIVKEIKKMDDFKEEVTKQINPQQLYDKLNQLESFKQQLANRYEVRFNTVKNEFLTKAREAFKNEITEQLSEINKVKNTIVAKTDPEIINNKLKELKKFEKDLTFAIDDKITQSLKIYEGAIAQKVNDKIKVIDEEIKKVEEAKITTALAKEKVDELNMFKDQFIAIIDKNIGKINTVYTKFEKLTEMEPLKEELANNFEIRFNVVKNEFIENSKKLLKDEINKELKKHIKAKEKADSEIEFEVIKEKLEKFEKELIKEIDEKTTETLKTHQDSITKEIEKKINTIDEKTNQSLKTHQDSITKEIEKKINTIDEKTNKNLKTHESNITKEVDKKITDVDKKIKELDDTKTNIELAKDTLEDLNKFKEQFIKVIDDNIEKINTVYTKLEDKIKEIEKEKKKN